MVAIKDSNARIFRKSHSKVIMIYLMSVKLSEEEMRQALFGSSNKRGPQPPNSPESISESTQLASSKPWQISKSLSAKLRVTLRVAKDFEGDEELFIYDANTLSTLVTEQEAKVEAKKKKFKHFDLVSVKSI